MKTYDALVQRITEVLSKDATITGAHELGRVTFVKLPTHLGPRHNTPDGPNNSLRIGDRVRL